MLNLNEMQYEEYNRVMAYAKTVIPTKTQLKDFETYLVDFLETNSIEDHRDFVQKYIPKPTQELINKKHQTKLMLMIGTFVFIFTFIKRFNANIAQEIPIDLLDVFLMIPLIFSLKKSNEIKQNELKTTIFFYLLIAAFYLFASVFVQFFFGRMVLFTISFNVLLAFSIVLIVIGYILDRRL